MNFLYSRSHNVGSVTDVRDRAHVDYDRRKRFQQFLIQETRKQSTAHGDREWLVVDEKQLSVLDNDLFDDLSTLRIGHESRELILEFLKQLLSLAGLEDSPFRGHLLPLMRLSMRNQSVFQKVLLAQIDQRP